ncbi:unnamed protein product, partial [Symbiodinium sp. KB8]
ALATIEMPRRRWLLLALALGTASLSFVSRFPTRSTTPSRTRRTRLGALTKEELEAVKAWEQKEEVVTDVREGDMIASHKFPIPAEELIQRTKLYLAKNQYGIKEPDMLAEDFEFVGQVIGPLDKATFIRQLGQFDLLVAFPDVKVRWHHFRVDPYDASRVWFTGRSMGTNLGAVPPLISEATNKAYESPPEACSLRFNEQGQVVEYTAGYVMDRRQGNTGGRGGLLGPLYAIGKGFPFPEAQPYEWSWQRKLFTWLGEALAGDGPK